MRALPIISGSLLLLSLLSGCQNLGGTTPPPHQRLAWEHRQPGCTDAACPLLNIDVVQFAELPQLNQLVERRLLEMTREDDQQPLPASLQEYEKNFFARGEPRTETYLQALIAGRHGHLLVLELSSYLYTGGAHGMPGRGFINYDLDLQRALSLDDMLEPGQKEAFWRQARKAHLAWLASQGLEKDYDYRGNWPFQETANVALLADGVLLKYDVYAIAPYSSGHPQLHIPYSELRGILDSRYLP